MSVRTAPRTSCGRRKEARQSPRLCQVINVTTLKKTPLFSPRTAAAASVLKAPSRPQSPNMSSSSSSSSSSSNMPRVDCSGLAAGRCSRAGSGSGAPPPPAVPGALPCVAAFRACSAFFNRLLASMFSASNSSASLAASAALANAFVFKAALLSRSHVGTPHARRADVSVKLPGSQCIQFTTHTGKAGAGRSHSVLGGALTHP